MRVLLPCALIAAISVVRANEPRPPNIVLVLADDLGWGDIGANGAGSRAPTPNVDRLARDGIRFTDAHAPASLCVATRYGILTGSYAWRNRVRRARTDGYAGCWVDPARATVASVLRARGYRTGLIGKWHLGFGDPAGAANFAERLTPGPVQLGFDRFFGLPASLDIPPYVSIDGERATEPLDRTVAASETPGARWAAGRFWRGGLATATFRHEDVLETWTTRAESWIAEWGKDGEPPFFLYVALTAPHTPWLPSEPFRGKSGAGEYGDFVTEVDATVGRILAALERAGRTDDTLVVFTSDNGAFWIAEEIERYGHRANGPWRGQKADVHEGGHRVPFIARLPGRVPAGSRCDRLLSLTDLLRTFATLAGASVPDGQAEDSLDQSELLLGREPAGGVVRRGMVHHTGGGFAIRDEGWKLVEFLGSGGFTEPRRVEPGDGEPPGQLYDLDRDPAETKNLWTTEADVVARLRRLLDDERARGVAADPKDAAR